MRIKSRRWAVSIVAASVGILALVVAFSSMKAKDGVVPIVVLFAMCPFTLAALVLGFVGLRSIFRSMRYGWELSCPDEGGVLGETLRVTLFPRRVVTASGDLRFHLRCLETSGPTRGRSSPTTRDTVSQITVWEASGTLPVSTIDPSTGVPIPLELPGHGRASVRHRNGSGITWQLTTALQADGIAHESDFEIPVRDAAG